MAVNLSTIDRSLYYFIESNPHYHNEAEWTPFHTQYFSEYVIAPDIEPGTFGSVVRSCDYCTTEAGYCQVTYM
jgi:hypothetical protein